MTYEKFKNSSKSNCDVIRLPLSNAASWTHPMYDVSTHIKRTTDDSHIYLLLFNFLYTYARNLLFSNNQ